MQVQKVFQVQVQAYRKQEVPKFTKYFDQEAAALTYQEEMKSHLWNTPVDVVVHPVYVVFDENARYVLNGSFVQLSS